MVNKSTKNNFSEAFDRIKAETGFKSIRQLAEILDKDHTTLLAAKKKKEFPAGWAYMIEKKYGLLTGWIMTGEGPKRLEEIKEGFGFYEELEQWARETGQSENTQWMRNQIESFFPMFKEWKKRRDEGEEIEPDATFSRVA
ncbi:MAG: helix-turn-helix domain containing protein [Desulfobulbus sp.]|nr:helix-turn-helix domain containing protein [Desulfobulbus sp.]